MPDYKQVNSSRVLRASFTDKTKAFFHLLMSDANTEAVNIGEGRFVKIFNSLNLLNFFTENCKTYKKSGKTCIN